MVRVTEIMVKDPIAVTPDTSVRDVARIMLDRTISSVTLVKGKKSAGIITERDLVRRVLVVNRNPDSLKAIDICSRPVIAISELDEVEAAVELMKRHRIRRLVVVDMKDNIVGTLTTDDLGVNMKRMSEELALDYMLMTRRGRRIA
jgi:CBS domain-containing protein